MEELQHQNPSFDPKSYGFDGQTHLVLRLLSRGREA